MSDSTCLGSHAPAFVPTAPPASTRRSAWGVTHLPGVPDVARCAQWIQREAGRHWRAGGSVLLLWVELTERGHDPQQVDRLMAELGRRARQRLRATDLVTQVGSAAVCAILFDAGDANEAGIRQRMQAGLGGVYALEGHSVTLGVSVGVAAQSGMKGGAEDLLAHARQSSQRG